MWHLVTLELKNTLKPIFYGNWFTSTFMQLYFQFASCVFLDINLHLLIGSCRQSMGNHSDWAQMSNIAERRANASRASSFIMAALSPSAICIHYTERVWIWLNAISLPSRVDVGVERPTSWNITPPRRIWIADCPV